MTKPKVMGNRIPDELIMRCAVGCEDFMAFSVTNIDENDWVEVSLSGEARPSSFWQLLKCCWEMFRTGRTLRNSADLSREQVAELEQWCAGVLNETQTTS